MPDDSGPSGTSRFSGWMAALAWAGVGLFALLATYTLLVDGTALNWSLNYAMWTAMGVSIVAGFLSMATEGR